MRLFSIVIAAVAGMITAGCVNMQYVGDVYPATQYVRFYMNEKDVPADTYREMGRAIVSIDEDDAAFRSNSVLSDSLREKAMQVGADAVVIISSERYKIGSRYSANSNTYYAERERGKSRGHYGRHHSSERYSSTTRGHADTYSTAQSYDLQRDEVTAKFLKLKKAK